MRGAHVFVHFTFTLKNKNPLERMNNQTFVRLQRRRWFRFAMCEQFLSACIKWVRAYTNILRHRFCLVFIPFALSMCWRIAFAHMESKMCGIKSYCSHSLSLCAAASVHARVFVSFRFFLLLLRFVIVLCMLLFWCDNNRFGRAFAFGSSNKRDRIVACD